MIRADPTPEQLVAAGQRILDRILLGLPHLSDKSRSTEPERSGLYHTPWRRPKVVECMWCGAGRTPSGLRMCTPECVRGIDPRLHWDGF